MFLLNQGGQNTNGLTHEPISITTVIEGLWKLDGGLYTTNGVSPNDGAFDEMNVGLQAHTVVVAQESLAPATILVAIPCLTVKPDYVRRIPLADPLALEFLQGGERPFPKRTVPAFACVDDRRASRISSLRERR